MFLLFDDEEPEDEYIEDDIDDDIDELKFTSAELFEFRDELKICGGLGGGSLIGFSSFIMSF